MDEDPIKDEERKLFHQMLSIENPSSDPSCSPQFTGSDDEVDLLKQPALDHHHHKNPLPNFSIRDYVFNGRSKDINRNWPFSSESLQFVLKHGMKDPLPPFQHLDIVRNQPKETHVVETNPIEKQRSTHHGVLDSYDIDSVLVDKQSISVEEGSSAQVKAVVALKSQKTEKTTKPSGKKCRLIVKFGGHSDCSSTEDIASNCSVVSESMGSKVCPVCKSFSSSSNTTLNAHIDQCLSVESTPKWTVDSKLTRHKIKPRKTKLLVDIYATAKSYTLEELDRRNGRSWALASNISDFEGLEMCDEGKKKRTNSQNNGEGTVDLGAVYVDANGTKLRILSKVNDVPVLVPLPPVSKHGDDLGPSYKSLKIGKGSKKKRCHALKHHKYLKHAPQCRKNCSYMTPSSMIVGGREGYREEEDSCKSVEPCVSKQIKSNDTRNFKERVCYKQEGLSRKPNNQEKTGDLRFESDQSHEGGRLVERNCVRKLKHCSKNPFSSPRKCARIEKPVYEAPVICRKERSLGMKRVRSALFQASMQKKAEKSLHQCEQNAKQSSSEDHPCLDDDHTMRSLNSKENCTSSLSEMMVDIDANSNPDSPIADTTTTIGHQFSAPKCFSFSLQKKKMSASSRSSMVESGSKLVMKHSTRENRLHFMAEIDEAIARDYEADQECKLVHEDAKNQREGNEITEELPSEPHSYYHDETDNMYSSTGGSEDIVDKLDGLESVEETITSLSQSLGTKPGKLSNIPKNISDSFQTNEHYTGPLCGGEGLVFPTEPNLVDKPNMFCAEVGLNIIGQAANVGELDSDVAQSNSFLEVDPILIPGPPGSFLPSPRDMGSDDFQGNASTANQIRSSRDQLDLVDGDSSDSPLSVLSTISNSMEARFDLKYEEPLAFLGAPPAMEKDRSGYSTAKSDPLVENGVAVEHTSPGQEKTFEGEKFRVPLISIEKKPFFSKNDDQPCCCQTKERSFQGFALNYHESQLLRRRTMASVMVPAIRMQNGANPGFDPNNLAARPETFSLTSNAELGYEQMVLPVMKPPLGPIPFKGCPDGGVKLSGHSVCDSASPSSSNPVLRLMGKNLMVVNKEEEASMPLGQGQPCARSDNWNQDEMPFHQAMPPCSMIFNWNPNDLVERTFDSTNGYRNRATLATPPQTTLQLPVGLFLDEHRHHSFTTSMEPYKLLPTARYNMEKVSILDCKDRSEESVVCSKEVIVIDDDPKNESNKTTDIAKRSELSRDTHGISKPLVRNHSIANHRYPVVIQNNNFHGTTSSSFMGTSHFRYYAPNLS
ncbi:hypothetical protein CXB51_021443 [Gossypium anomalum]|uniref:Uncharacterized protein n=1 Tax=Gossypium anomalum TaxID=47600 RepID=A0A8J6CYV9_9ROSI|nr:hypothetical protein CXB51_021443 [Gossypium anomalum]